MGKGSDSFVARIWAAIRELQDRQTSYIGKVSEFSLAGQGSKLPRVRVSGIDPTKVVAVHPTMELNDQLKALGTVAVGMDVLVVSIGGQLYGVSIQLTGETRW